MSTRLYNDLEQWESGRLQITDVERRHPRADVRGLAQLHSMLAAAASEAPPNEESWDRLRRTLPERTQPHTTSVLGASRWIRRPVLVAACTLLLGGSALAMTSEPVREGVKSAWRTVASLVNLDGDDSSESGTEPGSGSAPRGDDGSAGRPPTSGKGNVTTEPRGGERGRSTDAEERGKNGPGVVPSAPGKGVDPKESSVPPAGKPEDPGKSEGNGNSDDKRRSEGNPTNPDGGNPDAAGTLEDPGKSEGKSKSDAAGKPESAQTPAGSPGESQGPGKSEGKGKSDGAGKPGDPGAPGNGSGQGNGNGPNGD